MKYTTTMVYGAAGSGKTWFARAAAEHVGWDRTLWLHTERPIYSFDAHVWTEQEPYGIRSMYGKRVEDIIRALQPIRLAARSRQWKYDLIVLDGITELELVNFDAIENRVVTKDKRQLWGEQADDLMRLFWALRAGEREPLVNDLGAYVVVTAGERETAHPTEPLRSDGSPNLIYRPSIRGKWGTDGDRNFNQVLYTQHLGATRKLWLRATGQVHVKNDWEHLRMCPDSLTLKPYGSGYNVFREVLNASGLGSESKE